MDTQLKRLGIRYERQAAIDGRVYAFGAEYDPALAAQKNDRELLLGEVGCAASHKRVYEKMIAHDIPFALVLEDDVALPSDMRSRVGRVIQEYPGFEYVLFDYLEPGIPFLKRWFASFPVNMRGRSPIKKSLFVAFGILKFFYIVPLSFFEGARNAYKKRHPGLVKFYRPMYLAGAYLISKSGAQKMLNLAEPIIYPADKLPNQARIKEGLRFYAYAPLCVSQQKKTFGSSILEISGDDL